MLLLREMHLNLRCGVPGFSDSRAEQLWKIMYKAGDGGPRSWEDARDRKLIGKEAIVQLEGISRLDGGLELVQVCEKEAQSLVAPIPAPSLHAFSVCTHKCSLVCRRWMCYNVHANATTIAPELV